MAWPPLAFEKMPSGPEGTLGRSSEREVIRVRDAHEKLQRLNSSLPPDAIADAGRKLTEQDFSRSMIQHNRDFYAMIRDGIPVTYRDSRNQVSGARPKSSTSAIRPITASSSSAN